MRDKQSGIYMIVCLPTAKYYVGSAIDLDRRWWQHRNQLNRQVGRNPHLQSAWNKYGEDSFVFFVVESCSKETLLEREQAWLDETEAVKHGFNCNPMSSSTLGKTMSAEARAKMSEAWKHRTISNEARARMSAARKGLKHAPDVIAKLKAAMARRKMSPESIAKMAATKTGMPGRKWSEEQKRRQSETHYRLRMLDAL